MSNYTLYPRSASTGKCTTGQSDGEMLSLEAAMAQQEGLIHAFIQRQGGGAIDYDEALQAGRMGLWRAIQGYDPGRGAAFSTYAWVAICRAIHQAVAQQEKGVARWSKALPWAWYQPDWDQAIDQQLVGEALYEVVGQLPSPLQRIIVARYGLAGQPCSTLGQLGVELGLSGERVRQLQQDALAWLRHPAHSWRLRQRLELNTVEHYRQAVEENAALRRQRRGA